MLQALTTMYSQAALPSLAYNYSMPAAPSLYANAALDPVAVVAQEIDRRATNLGYGLGVALNSAFSDLVQPAKNLFHQTLRFFGMTSNQCQTKTERPKEIAQLETQDRNTGEPLTLEEALCLILDVDKNYAYPGGKVNLYVDTSATPASALAWDFPTISLNSLKRYARHANINFQTTTSSEQADLLVYPKEYIRDDPKLISEREWKTSAQCAPGKDGSSSRIYFYTSTYNEKKGMPTAEHVISAVQSSSDHEVGHCVMGERHPHEIPLQWYDPLAGVAQPMPSFLDSPDLTTMTYQGLGTFTAREKLAYLEKYPQLPREDIGFCDAVVAQQKYGANLSERGNPISLLMEENTFAAKLIATQGGIATLNAEHLTAAGTYVLEPGFCPIILKNSIYHLGPKSIVTTLVTSKHADVIWLGSHSHEVKITGGQAKTFVITPLTRDNTLEGFRWQQDKLEIHGDLRWTAEAMAQENHALLKVGQANIVLKGVALQEAKKITIQTHQNFERWQCFNKPGSPWYIELIQLIQLGLIACTPSAMGIMYIGCKSMYEGRRRRIMLEALDHAKGNLLFDEIVQRLTQVQNPPLLSAYDGNSQRKRKRNTTRTNENVPLRRSPRLAHKQ